jgi:flagellar motility protein MotE (MotC chaperone)
MTEQATEAVDNTQTTDSTQGTTIESTERSGTLAVEATPDQSWIEQLSDSELKGSKSLANFKDIDGLAKSYINLEKKLGAPREDVKYSAEDYGYELPEDYEPNEEILGSIKDKAFELGVKPDAFKALVETFVGKESEALNQLNLNQKEQADQIQESLKKEWGNKYEERLEQADKTWQQLTSPEDDKVLDGLQPDAKLAIAKLMDNISQKISTPSIGKQEGTSLLTKEEASNKIQAIYNDKDHPFHRGDQSAVAEVFELNKVKVGEV